MNERWMGEVPGAKAVRHNNHNHNKKKQKQVTTSREREASNQTLASLASRLEAGCGVGLALDTNENTARRIKLSCF